MMKHTFQKGDRVFGRMCATGSRIPGTFDRVDKARNGNNDGVLVHRDDGVTGKYPRLCWFAADLVEHDCDFRVGDWVRYEGIVENPIASLEGHIGTITEAHVDSARVRFPRITDIFLTGNLVKIAPPEEAIRITGTQEMADKMINSQYDPQTMTIEHDQWGRVEGVESGGGRGYGVSWAKNGAVYFHGEGWREVRPTRWEPVEVRIGVRGDHTTLDVADRVLLLPLGYRWKTAEIEREVEG